MGLAAPVYLPTDDDTPPGRQAEIYEVIAPLDMMTMARMMPGTNIT